MSRIPHFLCGADCRSGIVAMLPHLKACPSKLVEDEAVHPLACVRVWEIGTFSQQSSQDMPSGCRLCIGRQMGQV